MLGSLNDVQIEQFLRSQFVGRIGCYAHHKTYVVPITYVFEDNFIYAHTKKGMKTEWMELNPRVCFEVDQIDNLTTWRSVILWGTYEPLTGKEAEGVLQMLVNRIMPVAASETSLPRHSLDRPHAPISPDLEMVIFRIRIEERSGRFERP